MARIKLLLLLVLCSPTLVWAQVPFSEEYQFHSYLLREGYAEEGHRVLTQLLNRPALSPGQRDSLHYALGRFHYEQEVLEASMEHYGKVSATYPALWREATFFGAFGLAYRQQPEAGRQLLTSATFTDSLYLELSSFQQAGMALLTRDYEGYTQHAKSFTGTYFAFAQEEQNLAEWSYDLQAFRPKQPWVAGTLSALVPGLGRVYAGKWGQGLISFAQIALMGLGAWDGYRQGGVTDWRFITYSAVGGALYLSNIVGSAHAAQLHNQEFYEAVDYRVRVDMHVPLRTLFR